MDVLWLPTLTPYRLLVLLVGLVIGTFKAAFTYQGKTVAPIVLEWAGGTILFILWFCLGLMEDAEDLPPALAWFYNFDCIRNIFSCHQTSGTTRDTGAHYERRRAVSSKSGITTNRLPMVSGYNILLSIVVVFFGLVKAILSYLAYSTEVTAIDWLFGVLFTTCLYTLGLYQDRGGAILPRLFAMDYSRPASSITVSILAQILFYGTLVPSIWLTWNMFDTEQLKEAPFTPGPHIVVTPFDTLHDVALRAMTILTVALASLAMPIPSLIILLAFNRRFRYLLTPYRAIRKSIMWIAAQIPRDIFPKLTGLSSSLLYQIWRHIMIHVVICLIPLFTFSFIYMGLAIRLMHESLIVTIPFASFALIGVGFCIPVLKSLFSPLPYWRDETQMRLMLW